MNRIQIGTLITAVSLVAGVGLARQSDTSTAGGATSTESKSTTTTKSSAGTKKTKTHSASGTVKEFEAGKKIVVTTANNKDRSWALDDKDVTYDVDSSVAVGSKVRVLERMVEGKKTVHVMPMPSAASTKKTHMKSKKTKSTESTSSTSTQ